MYKIVYSPKAIEDIQKLPPLQKAGGFYVQKWLLSLSVKESFHIGSFCHLFSNPIVVKGNESYFLNNLYIF